MKSSLVAGSGSVMLTGPESASFSAQKITARTQSSVVVTGKYWSPGPSGPPRPSLKRGASMLNGGLRRSSTGAVRMITTRPPASTAGWAASCQAAVTLESNVSPRRLDVSVSSSSPWSP